MTLVSFVVTLVVLGIVWFLVLKYIPMPDVVKTVLNIVGVIVVIFLVLALFGVMPIPFKVS